MVYIIRYPTTKILGLRPYGLYHPLSYYEDIRANAPMVYIFRYPITKRSGLRIPHSFIVLPNVFL